MAGKRKKPASLSELALGSRTAPAAQPSSAGEPRGDTRKGLTLRLEHEAWRQLKILAVERDTTSHDLLIEALNDLFRKHGKAPIA